MSFSPTEEQEAALALFARGESMVIEAGAGTGKTSTLVMLAEASRRPSRYLAFNKSIVVDVEGRLPKQCTASTAHSLAYRQVGHRYKRRLNSGRMHSAEIARRLDVEKWVVQLGPGESKTLSAQYLAGFVMAAVGNFCKTADERPSRKHFSYQEGIDLPRDGKRTYAANNALRAFLEPALERAWADLSRLEGGLPFRHDHYLKLWQLEHPRIPADCIFFDEAQDANPVMAAVVAEQEHAQRVYVGDSCQAIYEFTGAVNALAAIDEANRRFLTQSWRFGDPIAQAANLVLEELEAPLRLRGRPGMDGTVAPLELDDADAILCRTNAGSMNAVLAAKERGARPHLIGGGKEVASFARAAAGLMRGESTQHPDLACFTTWGEVLEYVRADALGQELALLVKLVEEYGTPVILSALDRMPKEEEASIVVSTAHKAKGREWPAVVIDGDFVPAPRMRDGKLEEAADPSVAELRLRYVAITRAQRHLDHSALTPPAKPAALPA